MIDNAVKSFDRDWKKAKSVFDLSQEDRVMLGMVPGGIMSELVNPKSKDRQNND